MNLKSLTSYLGLGLILMGIQAQANENVVRIPLKTFIKPVSDMVDQNGKKLSFSDLERLHSQGFDLSKLNPTENKYWQNKKFAAQDSKLSAEMPAELDTVDFDDYLGSNRDLGIYSVYIRPSTNKELRYGLTLGLQVHASLTKAALLRKLGIYQEAPKYVNKLKVRFTSAEKMDEFINRVFCESGPSDVNVDCLSVDPFKREFITQVDKKQKTLMVHGVYIEKFNSEVPGLFDGLTPASHNTLPYFNQSRAFRSLVVPYVVGDVGESINRYSPQSAQIRGGWVYLNYLGSEYFNGFTEDTDAKWMLRKMAALTESEWTEIVDAGAFPPVLRELVRAKLIYRMKNMIESFFNREEQAQLLKVKIPSLNINSGDGIVVKGKVMVERIPGYPQRFGHGDRQSPFESADFIKYMKVKAQSAAIEVALKKLGEKLTKTSQSANIKGVELSPAGIRPIGDASGKEAGLGYSADRIITTGTYYGSQAPVQLVDNINLSASLGYNHLWLGLGGITRNAGANLAYFRDYTHVTPLESIKQVDKIPREILYGKSKLKSMASPLKDGKLTEFINELKVGEVFTITDSVGAMGRVGLTAALDAIIGFSSTFQPTVGLSVDGSIAIMRQIQFTKTAQGLQVFVRDQRGYTSYGLAFDVNYFINLMRIRGQTRETDIKTDVFLLDYDAALMSKFEKNEITPDEDLQKVIDKQQAMSGKAAAALRALIFQSSKDPLYSNFRHQQFEINHYLKTNEIQTKILWYRATQLDEEHLVDIYKPVVNAPEGSTVVNKPIQVVTHRKGTLKGLDLLGFGLDVFDGVLARKLKGNAPQFSQSTQNPSQMPFGRAEWRMVRSDTELTQDREGALPSVSILERVWGGWNLKKNRLDEILGQVKENMKGTQFADYPLLPDGALQHVEKIDFFRVTSHLTLLPSALDKVKDLVLAPEAAGHEVEKRKFIVRLFQKLSELGGNKARGQDMAVFKNLMRVLGNGNEQMGYQNYLYQCQVNKDNQVTYVWLKGTGYECLEPWIEKIINLSRKFPEKDLRAQNRWMTEVLFVLDTYIPQAFLLNEIGKENFIYYVEVTGFRAGDEDGDDGVYVSNVLGEPAKKSEYANGLLSVFSNKSRIVPVELDRSQGSFQ